MAHTLVILSAGRRQAPGVERVAHTHVILSAGRRQAPGVEESRVELQLTARFFDSRFAIAQDDAGLSMLPVGAFRPAEPGPARR